MKKHKVSKVLIWVLVLSIIIPVVFIGLLESFERTYVKLIQKEPSPDGEHIAYLIYVYAGATSLNNSQIIILDKYTRYSPLMRGNVFIGPRMDYVECVSDNELSAYYAGYSAAYRGFENKVYKAKTEYDGIKIEYK